MSGRPTPQVWPLCPRKRVRLPLGELPTVFCISPAVRRWIRIVVQYGLLAFLLMILIIWLGAEYEDFHVRRAADTLRFYEQPQVCAIIQRTPGAAGPTSDSGAATRANQTSQTRGVTLNQTFANSTFKIHNSSGSTIEIRTFPSRESASAFSSENASFSASETPPSTGSSSNGTTTTTTTTIAHCGECGACSTPRDIRTYDETKNSLFASTVYCAKRSLVWGRRTATKCMERKVAFSTPCNDCWVENIICDLRKCIFTCIWQGLFSQVETGENSPQALNRCTQCDELRCGPDFVTCAGANRRRSGILSDIERDQHREVCTAVKSDWWKDDALLQHWERQQDEKLKAATAGVGSSSSSSDDEPMAPPTHAPAPTSTSSAVTEPTHRQLVV